MKSKNRFLSNFIQTFQSEFILIIITLISGIIIARVLGPAGRGEYLAITIWGNLLMWYFHLNIYQTVIYYWHKMKDNRENLLKTLAVTSLFLGVVATLVGEFIIIPYVMPSLDSEVLIAARLFLIGIIPGIISEVILGALAAEEKFLFANMMRIINPTISTTFLIIIYYMGLLEVSSALYILLGTNTIIAIATFFIGYKNNYFSGDFHWELMKTLWYGMKAQGGTVAGATSANATQLVLSAMLPPAALGFYSASESSVKPLSTISTALQRVSFPRLAGLSADLTHQRTLRIWTNSFIANSITALPFALLLPLLIPIVYGKEYIPSIIPAELLIIYTFVRGQSMIIRNSINGYGKTFINTTTEIISTIFIFITLSFTVKHWGVIGASVIAVLSSILKLILYLVEYNKHIHQLKLVYLIPSLADFKAVIMAAFSIVRKGVRKRGRINSKMEREVSK
ncbi:lipopolysaccharide biosynthesis protein [Niallia circulans]|uniref:lipopolysaccharide biosynthesis protein n=1 Tax=Niallia circulans TaxID=1397 RepID=UPI00352C5B43